SVPRPGEYAIRRPDFRLFDAISDAGGVPPELKMLYVIRTVETARGRATTPWGEEPAHEPKPPATPSAEPVSPEPRMSDVFRPEVARGGGWAMRQSQPAGRAPATTGSPPASTAASVPTIEPLLPPPASAPHEPTLEELNEVMSPDQPTPPYIYDPQRG